MKKFTWLLSLILLAFNAVGALYGGSLLMLDPLGGLIHMPSHWLLHSPFVDYFIPGLILFFVNGVLSLMAAVMTYKKTKYYTYFISWQGVLLTGWIMLQVYFIQTIHPLHVVMGVIGVSLFVLGLEREGKKTDNSAQPLVG
jgi:hypothetical protein